MKKKEEKNKSDLQEKNARFLKRLADFVTELIAMEKAIDEKSKIVPVSPAEQKALDEVNARLGKGDKTGALQCLDQAFAKGVIPSVRYYQIRNSITSVDITSFFK
jgi:hypothetical protein